MIGSVGGILLTGGESRRLGVDKATLVLRGDETLAARALALLRTACEAVVEVGPGVSGAVRAVREDPAGGGPVAALLAGVRALGPGFDTVVVLACDYPDLSAAVVERLTRHDGDSLVPVIDGHPQYVAARYGPRALARLRDAHARGDASFRSLGLDALDELDARGDGFDPAAFADIDTPDDLARWRARSGS